MRNRSTLILAAAVVAIAAAARMPFWLSHTHAYGHGDAIIWEVWSRSIHEHGFINVFRTAGSNNVGYHYVLWPTSVIYGLISPGYELWTPALRVLIKVPAFACDVGLAAIIFFAARALGRGLSPWRRDSAAALAALAFALSPATVYDSMWWSQIDSVITICMLGAVLLLARGNPGWAWALLAAGFLFKPQPVVIVPVLAAFTYWRFGAWGSARGAAGALAAASAALTPFVIHGDARLIAGAYGKMFAPWEHDLAQGAWNGWSILDARGDPRPSDALLAAGGIDVTFMLLALALCVAVTLVALTYLRRNLDLPGLLLAASAMVFAFYMLPTSTHERYMYPMFALAAPLLVCAPRLVPGYAALAATFFLNLLAINPPSADPLWNLHGTDFAVVVAAVNVGIYAGFVGWMIIACLPHGWRLPAMVPRPAPLPAAAD